MDGNTFYYDIDDVGTVHTILDAAGSIVCKYDYENQTVSKIWALNENGEWIDATNETDSIGYINRLRYLGYYYDVETGWYYCGRYYDPRNDCFVTAPSHEYLYNSTSLLDIRLRGTLSYVYTEILNLFDSCMDDQRFGIPYDYSKNWYANLSDVEILARMIYGENTYRNRDNDRKGIAWVAANRYLSGRYTALFPWNISEHTVKTVTIALSTLLVLLLATLISKMFP